MNNESARLLGELFDVSAQTINWVLMKRGFLSGEPGMYKPTEKGKEHSQMILGYGNSYSWDNTIKQELEELQQDDEDYFKKAEKELREYRKQKKQEEEENDPYKYLLEGNNEESDSEDDDFEIETSNSTDALKYGAAAALVVGVIWYVGKCIKHKKVYNPFSKKNK